jgi:hypothetical protein
VEGTAYTANSWQVSHWLAMLALALVMIPLVGKKSCAITAYYALLAKLKILLS